MMRFNKWTARAAGALFSAVVALPGAYAAGGYEGLEASGANVHDMASLQRGAKFFVNYCHSCHSAEYMRYQRLAEDIEGLDEEMIEQNLLFGDQELTDYMKPAMPYEASADWFGKAPPDLTLVARSKGGVDWVYTFMKGFYLTDEGWNNTVLENASMPHVLWELQGIQRPVYETVVDENGDEQTRLKELTLDEPGLMTPEEYSAAMRDLSAFLIYMGEPAILERERLGVWVLLFLVVFTFLAWLLYHEYWKDVKK
ncbi:cytochrome c1 [Wenzhouxiangella sp. XN79A]|uniref:cytochrome c1 n=1 Tax=Wenzhouxiangella sp. XN79A TaxID=2724193 RepID=UPI00144ABD46|nr:cytochrome c1 [Wenzhouxiangella sp. XN79A]NKI34219.1 cytochrome c1 [Wenzhouxiangella sp. XN79A]